MNRKIGSVLLLYFMMLPLASADDPQFAAVFSNHMVLQRDKPVPVWGTGTVGEEVTVEFGKQSKSATVAADGKWMVKLDPIPANANPQKLTLRGKTGSNKEIGDVLVGEVWLGSGQSNMEWEMQWKEDTKADIAGSDHPQIRLLQVPLVASPAKQTSVNAKWTTCQPKTVADFSAVAYHFALKVHQELKVPVGIIQSAWGGTAIEPWTTLEGFESVSELKSLADHVRNRMPGSDAYKSAYQKYLTEVKQWQANAEAALKNNQAVPAIPAQPESLKAEPGSPTALYNAMIHPLVPFALRGAIWYQGESNHGEGLTYTHKKRALVNAWRRVFDNPDLAFHFVQIAPFQYGDEDPEILARFWVAQRNCLDIPNTGMAVITDIAEIPDIHPAHKKEVARRLALWALAKQYGRSDIDPSGPIFKSFAVEGNSIRIKFDHAETGLASRDGKPLSHFEIAGLDGQFKPATATIDGNTVLVSSPEVSKPRKVRFGWSKLAMPNLMDKDGLPACSFHTHWPVDNDLGKNHALNCSFKTTDPNIWGWNTGLTDGNWGNDAPHCFATGVGPFPKSVTIDLNKPTQINLIKLGVPNIGSTKTVLLAISNDGNKFMDVGKHAFGQAKAESASIMFEPAEARYIRLTYQDHHQREVRGYSNTFGFTSEVEAYFVK